MERNTYKRLPSFIKIQPTEQAATTLRVRRPRLRGGDRSRIQQAYRACWSGLVHAGWDSLRVSWFVHDWFKRSLPRGSEYICAELKRLFSTCRWAALHSISPAPERPSIRRDVVDCLVRLSSQQPLNGMTFSRTSRALPYPGKKAKEKAIETFINLSQTRSEMTMDASHWAFEVYRNMRYKSNWMHMNERSNARRRKAYRFNFSTNACFEKPSKDGGLSRFLWDLGVSFESRRVDNPEYASYFPDFDKERLLEFTRDSLGQRLLAECSVILYPERGGFSNDIRLSYQCLGVLLVRRHESISVSSARFRLAALGSPGLKTRVLGIPDALTIVEGDWISRGSRLMPLGHWVPGKNDWLIPRIVGRQRSEYYSVDLTTATDGIFHGVVQAIVEGLSYMGLLRRSDVPMALRSLGVTPPGVWTYGNRTWHGTRGSPMGTPLSFTILSWISSLSLECFSGGSLFHGDDAVGVSLGPSASEIASHEEFIVGVGCSVNRVKSFLSRKSFVLCEHLIHRDGDGPKGRYLIDRLPSIIAPDVREPLPSEGGRKVFIARRRRTMLTFFPWARRPSFYLPCSIGGLGYGRGLEVSRSVRRLLASLVSLNISPTFSSTTYGARPFRDLGVYPNPFSTSTDQKHLFKVRKSVEASLASYGPELERVPVSQEDFSIFKSKLLTAEYISRFGYPKRKVRTEHASRKTLLKRTFRQLKLNANLRPLSRSHGLVSLENFLRRSRSVPIMVDPDLATEIRG